MKIKFAVAAVSLMSLFASAEKITTWTGAGTSWNDAANWDNGVPEAGGKAIFNTDATITDDIILSERLMISVADGKTVNLNGIISGEGKLVFGTKYTESDTGTVNLNGDNTFVGNVAVSNGYLNINTDTACGTAEGEVYIYARNKKTKLNFNNVDFEKTIYMHNVVDADVGWGSFVIFNGNNTINFLKTWNNARFAIRGGITRLTGGVEGDSLFIPSPGEGAQLVIENTPIAVTFYQAPNKGELVFACEGNKISLGGGTGYHFAMPVRCDVNNALTEDSVFCVGEQTFALLNLNGTTQTIAQLRSKLSPNTYNAGSIISDEGGLLRVVGDFDSVVSNVVKGTASFECALPEGRTATIMNKHTSSGDLIVSSGKMILLENTYWQGDVFVKNGGTLQVDGLGVLPQESAVYLEDGCSVILPGYELPFDNVYLNGEKLPAGVYSSDGAAGTTRLEILSGTGTIRVVENIAEAVDAVWTGQGGDGVISTAANWQGSVLPSFSDGSLNAFFPLNNFTLKLDSDVKARGFAFTSDEAGTLAVAGLGNEQVGLFNSFVTVESESEAKKEVVFNVPVNLQGDCSFEVGRNSQLTLNEGLGSLGSGVFVKHGRGAASIHGVTNECSIIISNGVCRIYDSQIWDLGVFVTNGNTSIRVELDNCVVNGRLSSRNAPNDCCVSFILGSSSRSSTNIINGPINAQGHIRLYGGLGPGSKMYLRGGVEAGNFLILSGASTANSEVIIEETPFQGAPNQLYNDGNNVTMIFRTQNNYFKDQPWKFINTLRFEVDNVPRSNQILQFFKSTTGVIELCGTKQKFRCLSCASKTTIGTVTDTSEEGGGLIELSGSTGKDDTLLPKFAGNASLTISRESIAATNISENLTSGDLSISAGSLLFTESSTWTNGASVSVTGGKLTLDHSGVFARKTDLYMDGNGVIDLADGTVQTMQFLYMSNENGEYKKLNLGTYGSDSSPAKYKLACLSGTGVIEIVGDGKGTMLILK